jgi:hypothetical protein
LTWSALATEAMLPILLLSPFWVRGSRRLAVLLVVGLHLGFAACLNLGNFVPAMIAYTPNFIPAEDWDALARWWARSVKRVDFWARVQTRLTSWIVRLATLLTPGRWARVAGPGPVMTAIRRRLPAAREVTVVLLMGIAGSQVLDENWGAHKVIDHHNPKPVAAAVSYLGLFQGWSMFAPDAPLSDETVYVDAVTRDGRHVDPFNEVGSRVATLPVEQVPERLGHDSFWCDYTLRIPDGGVYHQAFIEWILRYPERTGHPQDAIVRFEAYSLWQDSPPPGQARPTNFRKRRFLQWP